MSPAERDYCLCLLDKHANYYGICKSGNVYWGYANLDINGKTVNLQTDCLKSIGAFDDAIYELQELVMAKLREGEIEQ